MFDIIGLLIIWKPILYSILPATLPLSSFPETISSYSPSSRKYGLKLMVAVLSAFDFAAVNRRVSLLNAKLLILPLGYRTFTVTIDVSLSIIHFDSSFNLIIISGFAETKSLFKMWTLSNVTSKSGFKLSFATKNLL